MVRYLASIGANLEAVEFKGGRNALHLAIENGRHEVARFIVNECRVDLDAETWAGVTSYQLALHMDKQLARELHRCGATPSLLSVDRTNYGYLGNGECEIKDDDETRCD